MTRSMAGMVLRGYGFNLMPDGNDASAAAATAAACAETRRAGLEPKNATYGCSVESHGEWRKEEAHRCGVRVGFIAGQGEATQRNIPTEHFELSFRTSQADIVL